MAGDALVQLFTMSHTVGCFHVHGVRKVRVYDWEPDKATHLSNSKQGSKTDDSVKNILIGRTVTTQIIFDQR
jgi:hypothetical protein